MAHGHIYIYIYIYIHMCEYAFTYTSVSHPLCKTTKTTIVSGLVFYNNSQMAKRSKGQHEPNQECASATAETGSLGSAEINIESHGANGCTRWSEAKAAASLLQACQRRCTAQALLQQLFDTAQHTAAATLLQMWQCRRGAQLLL